MRYVKFQVVSDLRKLYIYLDAHGFMGKVYYFPGNKDTPPHLKFEDDDEALLFCLKMGGQMVENL